MLLLKQLALTLPLPHEAGLPAALLAALAERALVRCYQQLLPFCVGSSAAARHATRQRAEAGAVTPSDENPLRHTSGSNGTAIHHCIPLQSNSTHMVGIVQHDAAPIPHLEGLELVA
mmetsp:Transcript_67516/g.162039  ORF Transcript_67516/g.162039 Transcript_67516/m.162039 type:complete len:117 (-) Transcript_67516:530-880(-)